MQVIITLEVDEGDECAEPSHEMGITNAAYERLTGYPSPLSWLGEVTNVERVL